MNVIKVLERTGRIELTELASLLLPLLVVTSEKNRNEFN